MTKDEEREYEEWKRSFGSEEALSARVYYYLTDPYWWDGPQQRRFVKKGAGESQIMEYYEYVREKEKEREEARRELEESNRRYAEREANEAAKKRQRRIIDGSVSDADRNPAVTSTKRNTRGMSSRLTTAEEYRIWAAEQDKRFEETNPEIAKQRALKEKLQSEK